MTDCEMTKNDVSFSVLVRILVRLSWNFVQLKFRTVQYQFLDNDSKFELQISFKAYFEEKK